MKITITYCVECEYLPLAQRLADGVSASLGVVPVLEGGHDGIFAVKVDEKEVFNNLKRGGHVPSDGDIIEMVRTEVDTDSPNQTSARLLRDVMNPMGYPPQIVPAAMAPRPTSFKGRTVYLVDARFDDSDRFLLQMQRWFGEHMPETKTEFVKKSGVYTEEDWDLWARIKKKGDAMIMGVGH
jgi:predicted Rdx family selenoprotein